MEERFIGNYKALKQIGAGGMARVYLAVHRDIPNLKVILKILGDPRMAERFKQEADKLALLDGNQHVCQIKHFFSHKDDTIIVMEYIDGETVEEKIAARGKLSIEESLQIISDVLDTLSFAHQKGIYHRDIKPSNIMLDRKGQTKIIDFGIAKAETDPNLTLAGTACGTPAYMAPEQFTPSEDTNYALIDVYAAGTTLFKMLTGECPFKGDNEFAIRDSKLFSDPPRPRTTNPDIPPALEDVILKAIAKEPARRLQSAAAMRSALESACREAAEPGPPVAREVTVDVRLARRPKGRRPIWIAVGVIGIAAIAYVAFKSITGGAAMGTIQVSVLPQGNVYVDDSLVAAGVSTFSLSAEAGRHVVRAYNSDATVKALYDTVWVAADSVTPVAFEFSIYVTPMLGTLEINVTPQGNIYFDDSLIGIGIARASVQGDTGRHFVRVENRRATRKVLQDTVWLAADDVASRSYRFTIPGPSTGTQPVEPAYGEVRVGSRPPGAAVYIDGELRNEKTIYTFKLEPGEHVIRVELDYQGQHYTDQRTVQVQQKQTHKVTFDFMNR